MFALSRFLLLVASPWKGTRVARANFYVSIVRGEEEGMAGPGNDVCVQTAEFVLKHLPVGCRSRRREDDQEGTLTGLEYCRRVENPFSWFQLL